MEASPTSSLNASRILRASRGVALGVALPILLAWAITHALHRRPQAVAVAAKEPPPALSGYGQLRLRLKLPGTNAGIAEPLISCGVAGDASLVFIKLLPKSRAKVGVEFWGAELDQGEEFALPAADAEIDLACDLPAFYPAEGDAAWGRTPAEVQKLRRNEFVITVDGVVRLRGSIAYPLAPHSPLYLGANPLGGSFVSNRFTGGILANSQTF